MLTGFCKPENKKGETKKMMNERTGYGGVLAALKKKSPLSKKSDFKLVFDSGRDLFPLFGLIKITIVPGYQCWQLVQVLVRCTKLAVPSTIKHKVRFFFQSQSRIFNTLYSTHWQI